MVQRGAATPATSSGPETSQFRFVVDYDEPLEQKVARALKKRLIKETRRFVRDSFFPDSRTGKQLVTAKMWQLTKARGVPLLDLENECARACGGVLAWPKEVIDFALTRRCRELDRLSPLVMMGQAMPTPKPTYMYLDLTRHPWGRSISITALGAHVRFRAGMRFLAIVGREEVPYP